MKGLIVKSKDKTCKAGIPQCGVGIVANITWHSGLTWTLSGLKMPEEIHLVWNGGMLEIGDVVEVEIAEFDEASTPVAEDKHCCLMEEQSDSVDESKDLEHKLNKNEINSYSSKWLDIVNENSDIRLLEDNNVKSVSYDYLNDYILIKLKKLGSTKISKLTIEIMKDYHLIDLLVFYLIRRLINENKIIIVTKNEDNSFEDIISIK